MTFKYKRSDDHTESRNGNLFLEKIPEDIYQQLEDLFASKYHFVNGERLHLAEYFVGISQSIANTFLCFIKNVIEKARLTEFPPAVIPDGFSPTRATLLPNEQNNGFSFAYFDAAITGKGIKIIEFQAFPTYSLISAKMSFFLRERLSLSESLVFPNAPHADWNDFIALTHEIIAGENTEGVVIVDRNLNRQKTNFSFFAIQHELNVGIDVVDARHIFEQDSRLFYHKDLENKQIQRFYNRLVPTEAIIEEKYPGNPDGLRFRFDQAYEDMVFVNHPCKFFEVSKSLLPYIEDPVNPPCYELAEVADQFRSKILPFSEFVWKDKWGYAGHFNMLMPNMETLDKLTREKILDRYIAQQKVPFEVFRTGDGLEKIIELRFMTVQSDDRLLVVPMARIGHVHRTREVDMIYKIHFGDNNMPGYGFCPVLIF